MNPHDSVLLEHSIVNRIRTHQSSRVRLGCFDAVFGFADLQDNQRFFAISGQSRDGEKRLGIFDPLCKNTDDLSSTVPDQILGIVRDVNDRFITG